MAIIERDGRDDEVGLAGRPLTVWERGGAEVGRVEPSVHDGCRWWGRAWASEGACFGSRDGAIRAVRQALWLPLEDALEDARGTTHHAECWRYHHACAVAEVERLRAAGSAAGVGRKLGGDP